jgi:4-amino-4-deoxy-L-arabinose transferase-like glycosyltransferase
LFQRGQLPDTAAGRDFRHDALPADVTREGAPFVTAPPAEGVAAWQPALTALAAALAFALSPLILLWGRIPVSDALFTAMVSLTCLAAWRRLADASQPWALAWVLLGLAVLTKGPVAVVLLTITLALFLLLQGDAAWLLSRLRPLPGLLLTALVAVPWYGLALWRDGRSFWDSFIGYHNVQRFTGVVNDHLQPWWYFVPVLLLAALPVTPLLLLALVRAVGPLRLRRWRGLPLPAAVSTVAPEQSLARFAACWLVAVLLFFTAAATKLPSYWLPATPAAALLIALVCQLPWRSEAMAVDAAHSGAVGIPGSARRNPGVSASAQERHRTESSGSLAATASMDRGGRADRWFRLVWRLSLVLAAVLALAFAVAPLWVPLIFDPEMPTLPAELLASGFLVRAAWLWGLAALLGWMLRARPAPLRLLALQLPLVLFVPAALLPSWALGDRLRGLPVRQMAAAATRLAAPREPLAMVGILKPSLHYYSGRVVIYEGIEPEGLVNLADRLRQEDRPGQNPAPPEAIPTALVVIDRTTAASPFWQGLQPIELSRAGLYRLWRLERTRLERRAAELREQGHPRTWTRPRPERY